MSKYIKRTNRRDELMRKIALALRNENNAAPAKDQKNIDEKKS